MASLIGHIMDKKVLGKVLFIDANLENPVFHSAFNLNLSPGLCEILQNEAKHEDVIFRIASSNVHIIPAGFASSIESSTFVQNNLIKLINEIRDIYDHILIESSPIFTSSDALAIAVASDVTALVVQAGRTELEIVEKALRIFHENECDVEGLVLNRVRHVIPEWIYNKI
jgi:Mrp family chromosome partitioning ATPase